MIDSLMLARCSTNIKMRVGNFQTYNTDIGIVREIGNIRLHFDEEDIETSDDKVPC